MNSFIVRNVQEALPLGLTLLQQFGINRDSRNGKVIMMDGPVSTLYEEPRERVIFWPLRDANPFLHFFESLWMMAGRDDVEYLDQFSKNMKTYSDDGKRLHGAYGRRWVGWWHDLKSGQLLNQLEIVAEALKKDPDSRRCVVQMWDPATDLGKSGKDFPCNTSIMFSISIAGGLDMTVINRSNDMIWGAYGANAVHFSFLQEVMASWIGVPVGRYWQFSNNFHAYDEIYQKMLPLATEIEGDLVLSPGKDPYRTSGVAPYPIVNTSIATWFQDLKIFIEEGPIVGLNDPFFRRVATPLLRAHQHFKKLELGEDRYVGALEILEQCEATDWRMAAEEWIDRRYQKFLRQKDDGVTHE